MVASLASVGREVTLNATLKDQMEASMVLWAGEEQVEMQENLPYLRSGRRLVWPDGREASSGETVMNRSHRTCRAWNKVGRSGSAEPRGGVLVI